MPEIYDADMSDTTTTREIRLSWPLDKEQSARLLDFCLAVGVDCFNAAFLYTSEAERQAMESQFFDQLAPYSLGQQPLENMVVYDGRSQVEPITVWRLNEATIKLILEACDGSLSSEQVGRYPEDWAFYQNGRLLLGLVTHEGCAFVRLSDKDLGRFNSLGISPEYR